MLILPPGHAQSIRVRRSLSARERWSLSVALGAVAALAVAVVLAVSTSGHSTSHGCIDVTIPYSVGGQEFYRCGAGARAMCARVGVSGGYTGRAGQAVAEQCRRAGLPVGGGHA